MPKKKFANSSMMICRANLNYTIITTRHLKNRSEISQCIIWMTCKLIFGRQQRSRLGVGFTILFRALSNLPILKRNFFFDFFIIYNLFNFYVNFVVLKQYWQASPNRFRHNKLRQFIIIDDTFVHDHYKSSHQNNHKLRST